MVGSLDFNAYQFTAYFLPKEQVGEQCNEGISLVKNEKGIVFSRQSLESPSEIYLFSKDKGVEKLTDFNSIYLKDIKMSKPQEFHFPGANEENVQGWILKPINFQESKKYPVALIIHVFYYLYFWLIQ